MAVQRKSNEGSRIGELYGKITVSDKDYFQGQRKLAKKIEHPFVRLCKRIAAFSPGLGKNGKFNEANQQAVAFLNWKLSPEEFSAASTILLVVSLFAAFLVGTVMMFTPVSQIFISFQITGIGVPIVAYVPFLLIGLGIVSYFQTYPETEAKMEQTRALTYVPEIMGYMIMSIKLVPNLEKAVEFAAGHGRGKIADDFKNLLWESQIGVHNSLSEGLDKLAYKWGQYSDDFKRSMMRIRDSVIESSDARRYSLLDQTMTEMLENIRTKMEQYVRGLQQPTTMLFYIGILLPLMLIIILPVGSSFSGTPLANPIVLFIIYDVLIPATMIVFAFNILQNKPPTYRIPEIPDNQPGLPKKFSAKIGGVNIDVRAAVILLLVFGSVFSFVASVDGLPPRTLYSAIGLDDRFPQLLPADKQKIDVLTAAGREITYFDISEEGVIYPRYLSQETRRFDPDELDEETLTALSEKVKQKVLAEEKIFYSRTQNDIAPYNLVFGILITFSLMIFVYFYYTNIYKRKIQLEVMEMESDFKDSIYIIASRMAENKPVEEALKSVQQFLHGSKVTKIFAKTLDNINMLGMPLSQAVFDTNYGSIAHIPSEIIRSSMKIMVDSVQLGVNVAARTLISLSIQLQNSDKVNKLLNSLISDITGTMTTMTLFIAPLVLGITTSLQRIVIVTMSSVASSSFLTTNQNLDVSNFGGGAFTGVNISSIVSPESIAGVASPTEFIIIVAVYIIELVIIMTFFTTKIQEDNDLLVKINIARFVPIAVVMFVISIIASKLFVGATI